MAASSPISTEFNKIYEEIMESMTCAAFGGNAELYSDLGTPTADTYEPGDARMPKVLGGKRKIVQRRFPETVFLTGKTKKNKKNRK